jgi:hypothetical protein
MDLNREAKQGNDLQQQVEPLAFAQGAAERTATAAAEQARQRPLLKLVKCHSRSGGAELQRELLPNEAEQIRAMLVELEQRVARDPAAAKVPNEYAETLTAQTAAADRWVAELTGEVDAAREALLLQENENYPLQTSLGLIVCENSRLSQRLTESAAALGRASSQHKQKTMALTVAEAERNKLAAAVDEANRWRPTKTNTPHSCPEVMSSTAVAEAEQWLRLLVRMEKNRAAERRLTDAVVARDTTDKKLALLQNSLQVKEYQVQELEQSRSTLIEITDALLKTFKMRDTAPAHSEERIRFLSQRVAQLEAEASLAKGQETIEEINSKLLCERQEFAVAGDVGKNVQVNWTELLHKLEIYVRQNRKYSGRLRARASETLLSDTITF